MPIIRLIVKNISFLSQSSSAKPSSTNNNLEQKEERSLGFYLFLNSTTSNFLYFYIFLALILNS